uniref:Uncharacterized protein n=1 Tax=Anguilla anguilla TaxID=7936 RepID=A0A0E9WCB6_ANGAN
MFVPSSFGGMSTGSHRVKSTLPVVRNSMVQWSEPAFPK